MLAACGCARFERFMYRPTPNGSGRGIRKMRKLLNKQRAESENESKCGAVMLHGQCGRSQEQEHEPQLNDEHHWGREYVHAWQSQVSL